MEPKPGHGPSCLDHFLLSLPEALTHRSQLSTLSSGWPSPEGREVWIPEWPLEGWVMQPRGSASHGVSFGPWKIGDGKEPS